MLQKARRNGIHDIALNPPAHSDVRRLVQLVAGCVQLAGPVPQRVSRCACNDDV